MLNIRLWQPACKKAESEGESSIGVRRPKSCFMAFPDQGHRFLGSTLLPGGGPAQSISPQKDHGFKNCQFGMCGSLLFLSLSLSFSHAHPLALFPVASPSLCAHPSPSAPIRLERPPEKHPTREHGMRCLYIWCFQFLGGLFRECSGF